MSKVSVKLPQFVPLLEHAIEWRRINMKDVWTTKDKEKVPIGYDYNIKFLSSVWPWKDGIPLIKMYDSPMNTEIAIVDTQLVEAVLDELNEKEKHNGKKEA